MHEHIPHNKIMSEFQNLFSKLSDSNREHAMAILRGLYFAETAAANNMTFSRTKLVINGQVIESETLLYNGITYIRLSNIAAGLSVGAAEPTEKQEFISELSYRTVTVFYVKFPLVPDFGAIYGYELYVESIPPIKDTEYGDAGNKWSNLSSCVSLHYRTSFPIAWNDTLAGWDFSGAEKLVEGYENILIQDGFTKKTVQFNNSFYHTYLKKNNIVYAGLSHSIDNEGNECAMVVIVIAIEN